MDSTNKDGVISDEEFNRLLDLTGWKTAEKMRRLSVSNATLSKWKSGLQHPRDSMKSLLLELIAREKPELLGPRSVGPVIYGVTEGSGAEPLHDGPGNTDAEKLARLNDDDPEMHDAVMRLINASIGRGEKTKRRG